MSDPRVKEPFAALASALRDEVKSDLKAIDSLQATMPERVYREGYVDALQRVLGRLCTAPPSTAP